MPFKCFVPGCRANYDSGPQTKVHMFKFPQNQDLREAWIRAISREDFVPTQYSKVCEHHFRDEDILRESSYTDVTTGRVITAALTYVRLRPGAVPCKFPDDRDTEQMRLVRKRTKQMQIGADAQQKGVAESIEVVVEKSRTDEETENILGIEDPDARRLRPRRKRVDADAMESVHPQSIQTVVETLRSKEGTDENLGVKEPDTRRMSPRRKRQRRMSSGGDAVQAVTTESTVVEVPHGNEETDKILCIKDLADYMRSKQHSLFWHAIEGNGRLILAHIVEDEAPWIKYSVVVKGDLTLTCSVVKTPVTKLGAHLCIPTAAKSKSAVMEFLQSIENWDKSLNSSSERLDEDINEIHLLGKLSATPAEDKAHAIQFLSEQLKLLSTKKERRHYSSDFMVFSCILFTISPHAYKYIHSSGSITLPHPMLIRSICLSLGKNPQPEHQSATFLRYVAKRISDLDDRHRSVTVMVDEVHIKPYLEYKGGYITDLSPNSIEVAESVLVLTVQSLTCQFKEVVHTVPVQIADAQFLHKLLKNVICGLEKIGFRVVCVVSDGNSVNRTAMSHFTSPPTNESVYPHPSDPARQLFLVIDPVHILKGIRNNWLDQSNDLLCFYFPEFEAGPTQAQRVMSASLATIRDAYKLECNKLIKYGCCLSRGALCPSDTERENVKFALQIFNDSLPQALRALGVKHNLRFFEGTASFIEIVVKWWKILNVKAPNKGKAQRDQFQEPVFPADDDPKVDFLCTLLDWLDKWESKDLDTGRLTSETHAALQQTTRALVKLAKYCFAELKLSYVFLGNIQTDSLEERFGNHRQLTDSQYHMSIRQLYEGEELWTQNAPPTLTAACGTESDRDEEWEGLLKGQQTLHPNYGVVVTGGTLSKMEDILPVLVYVTGYAVQATLKELNCAKCRLALTLNKMITISVSQRHYRLVKELDGGGLLFPTMFAVNAVAYSYVVVEQLSKQVEISKMPDHRQLVTDLTVELLTTEESSNFDACEDGHTSELVLRHVLWCSTNILFKNLCCSVNKTLVAT